MKNKFNKILLSTAISLAAVLPTLANTSDITLTASTQDFLIVQIELIDNTVVSEDEDLRNVGAPANEILDFGDVDARGIHSGTLTTHNGTPSGGLQRVLLDAAGNIYSHTTPPTSVTGALYFIKDSYQIRTVRNPGPGLEMTTEVDVDVSGELPTLIDLSGANTTIAPTGTLASSSLKYQGSLLDPGPPPVYSMNFIPLRGPDAVSVSAQAPVANNVPFPIDLGIFVGNSAVGGDYRNIITFTGS